MPFNVGSIVYCRWVLNMTQCELAAAIGVTSSTIFRWESGSISPSAVHLGEIYDLVVAQCGVQPLFFVPPCS